MSNFYQNAGRKFEKRITNETGGKATPGSGNQWYAPADTEAGKFLIESKLTGQDHYVLKLDLWFKLEHDAMKIGRVPVIILGFYGGQEYSIIHRTTWDQIVDNPDNYLLTKLARKGKLCTRLQRNILRTKINRVPASNLTNLLSVKVADEEFIVAPKQLFFNLKESYESC